MITKHSFDPQDTIIMAKTRSTLILAHDSSAFGPVHHMTVGEFREFILGVFVFNMLDIAIPWPSTAMRSSFSGSRPEGLV